MRALRLAIVLSLVLGPATALARSVVLLVPEPESPDSALVGTRAAMIEALAERGVRLVRTPEGAICEDEVCARAMAERTGADFVALLRVDGPRVRVTAVPAHGAPVDASGEVGESALAAVAASALTELLEREEIGLVGFLMVRSDPPDAQVRVNGETVGRTPLRVTLPPGEHTVRVRGGAGVHEEVVTVVAREETRVDAGEASRDEDGEDPGPSEPIGPVATQSSPFNFLLGAGLALGGVIALISPLSTFAQEGQCVDEIEGVGCVERVVIGAQTGVLLGVGLAALIAALVVDVTAPIRVEVTGGVSPSSAEAGLRVVGAF